MSVRSCCISSKCTLLFILYLHIYRLLVRFALGISDTKSTNDKHFQTLKSLRGLNVILMTMTYDPGNLLEYGSLKAKLFNIISMDNKLRYSHLHQLGFVIGGAIFEDDLLDHQRTNGAVCKRR